MCAGPGGRRSNFWLSQMRCSAWTSGSLQVCFPLAKSPLVFQSFSLRQWVLNHADRWKVAVDNDPISEILLSWFFSFGRHLRSTDAFLRPSKSLTCLYQSMNVPGRNSPPVPEGPWHGITVHWPRSRWIVAGTRSNHAVYATTSGAHGAMSGSILLLHSWPLPLLGLHTGWCLLLWPYSFFTVPLTRTFASLICSWLQLVTRESNTPSLISRAPSYFDFNFHAFLANIRIRSKNQLCQITYLLH